MTDTERTYNLYKAQEAIDNHENLKSSYCWGGDNGSGQARTNRMKALNFTVRVESDGDVYEYISSVSISRTNFYYKGHFSKNGKRGDVRLFKKLLSN